MVEHNRVKEIQVEPSRAMGECSIYSQVESGIAMVQCNRVEQNHVRPSRATVECSRVT